jgi:hypothetical protein
MDTPSPIDGLQSSIYHGMDIVEKKNGKVKYLNYYKYEESSLHDQPAASE